MKLVIVAVLGLSILCAPGARSQSNSIIDFYAYADSITQLPPVDKEMKVICSHKLDGKNVTFIGFSGEPFIRIVAVTLSPITDVKKEISLTVDFEGIHPTPGKISTWAYMYDRNGDGKIDYLALVGGAAAFEGADFPDNFPKHGQPMSRKQIDYFVGQCRTIFNHVADDNYDGKIDAMVQVDMDPDREWVRRKLLVRSTSFDSTFDDVRAFRNSFADAVDTVRHTPHSVPYHPVAEPADVIDRRMFESRTAILDLINRAIRACKLTPQQLPRRVSP